VHFASRHLKCEAFDDGRAADFDLQIVDVQHEMTFKVFLGQRPQIGGRMDGVADG
jgi:hypothetical protein